MTERFVRSPTQKNMCQDGLVDYSGPIGRSFIGNMFNPIKSGLARDGILFSGKELTAYVARFAWAASTESALMNLTEELHEQYKAAEKLWDGYKDKLVKFRSEVKNDVDSLQAAARRTTDAVHRMTEAYSDVIAQLNSPEMAQAVANAERLASALSALAQLQTHKLVFAVSDQSSTSIKNSDAR